MGLARWGMPLAGLLVVLTVAPSASALEKQILSGDGAAGDQFGKAVAIQGRTAVVGAPQADDGRGAVYVFSRFGNNWVQVAKLTASDRAAGDSLGDSVAIDGEVIVAGAPGDNPGTDPRGSVYQFSRTGAADRRQTGKLTTSGSTARLGKSVDIDGDRIVAGVPDDKAGHGAAYIFNAAASGPRTQIAQLIASDPSSDPVDDLFGGSVAIDGDTVVVGARHAQFEEDLGAGAVYLFARTGVGATRFEKARLSVTDEPSFPRHEARVGRSVDIQGDTIVAGAEHGAVYTFARTGVANRTQTARLTPADPGPAVDIGWSVAIDGPLIVSGAPINNSFNGSMFVFDRTGGDREDVLHVMGTATDGQLGHSVAINGTSIAVGRHGEKIGDRADQGSAFVYYAPENVYICSDGLDNDRDTLIDFPADPGCDSPTDQSEINAINGVDCDDGADNDNDGKTDYPDDTGCERPGDPSELGKQCRDGLDNDGDGLVDFPKDKGCSSATDGSEGPPMKLALKAPKRVEKGRKAKLVARLDPCPRLADLEVRFQRKTKAGFKAIGTADAKEPDCKAKLSRAVNRKTVFRAVTKRARGYLGATSDTVTVKIRAPSR